MFFIMTFILFIVAIIIVMTFLSIEIFTFMRFMNIIFIKCNTILYYAILINL